MVTARRENTTCDIRSNGAYGIIVGQERNQVMDSGGMPGASPKKERNRVRRFRDIGRALCRCSIIANRERCVNPPVRRVIPSCDAFPSRFRAGRNRRRNGSQLQHHYLRQFSKQPSRGPSLAAIFGMRRSWTNRLIRAIADRLANQVARRSEGSADRPNRTKRRDCGTRKLKGGGAAG